MMETIETGTAVGSYSFKTKDDIDDLYEIARLQTEVIKALVKEVQYLKYAVGGAFILIALTQMLPLLQ